MYMYILYYIYTYIFVLLQCILNLFWEIEIYLNKICTYVFKKKRKLLDLKQKNFVINICFKYLKW